MEIADSEREEGEIVDDELEDVSDCSISSLVHLGKSVSGPERLRSVSLSSISDSELDAGTPRKHPPKSHHLYTRPHRPKRKRKHGGAGRRAAAAAAAAAAKSDSDDERFDRRTLQQLKEAVRVNTSEEIHHNSLRTRLQALIEPGGEGEKEDVLVVDDGDKTAENGGDLSNDKELEELRLEALKSAVLKKHFERKKRKALEKEKSEKLEGGDINKENTVDNVITAESGANKEEAKKNEVSAEDDVDIMRAMLLASMSRKITEASKTAKKPQIVQPSNNNNTQKPIKHIVKNNYYTSNNKIVNCVKNNTFKPAVPRVEPLIINLNNDSGSDMDIEEDEENDDVAKSVTDFLNQQRAAVEAKKAEKEKTSPPVLNKSVMRLLPFSQQIEYLRLKQQLQAKRVKLQKPPAQNQTVGKIAQNEIRNVRNKTVMRSKFSLVKQAAVKDRIRVVRANKFERNTASSLQRTLSDMQTQKDGRLEVKGKYQELAPILKKVNQVSVERKRHENEIKRLLQELEKMQQNYSASHRNFKSLMEELMRKKEAIDKRTTVINRQVQKDPVFTTPVKVTQDLSLSQLEDNVILASSTPIATNNPPNCPQQQQQQQKQQESEAKTEKDIHEIVDPNDLNEHIMYRNKNLTETSTLPKYVSPLDKRDNDCVLADPLAMLCPFDLLGVCKDQECIYKHCS